MVNMKEEQEIIKKCGKGNPFKVPEGYFEDFTRNMMAQLPAKEDAKNDEVQTEPRITPWQRIKPLLYLAAMFIGMIVCVRVVLGEQTAIIGDDMENATASEFASIGFEQMTDEELCTMVEYTMMDNYTLYQYLSEVE